MARLKITEEQFKRTVIDMARVYHWHVMHTRPALTKKGWRTPIEGHPGFVDLVLARDGVVLLVELKSETGKLGPGQADWGEAIGPVHYRLWRPSQIEEIRRELQHDHNTSASA